MSDWDPPRLLMGHLAAGIVIGIGAWAAFMIYVFLIAGCASPERPPGCTWYCGNLDNVPDSCGCIEDMLEGDHP